jgi:hypothetical protein
MFSRSELTELSSSVSAAGTEGALPVPQENGTKNGSFDVSPCDEIGIEIGVEASLASDLGASMVAKIYIQKTRNWRGTRSYKLRVYAINEGIFRRGFCTFSKFGEVA